MLRAVILGLFLAGGAPRPKVVVLPVSVDAAAKGAVGAVVDDFVLTAVQGLGRFEVVGGDDLNAVLGFERQRDLLGCDDSRCFAEIGGALGADELLVVKIAQVAGKWALTGKRIALAGTPSVTTRATASIAGDGQALLDGLPGLVGKLFAEAPPASTTVSVNPSSPATSPTCTGADCYAEAERSYYGRGALKDLARAAQLFQRACDGGHLDGCVFAGYCLEHGEGVSRDDAAAARLYGTACERGSALACNDLGELTKAGRGVPQDLARAVSLYERACTAKEGLACANLGWAYGNGEGVKRDEPKALGYYERACTFGNATGCNNLGWALQQGLGVAVDHGRAADYFERACQGGSAAACTNLGYAYAAALGVTRDTGRAVALYERACGDGDPQGCANLGDMYVSGYGVSVDCPRGLEQLRRSCKLGNTFGCQRLRELGEKP